MPLLETDLIFAYLNKEDQHHKTASKLFNKIKEGAPVNISPLTLIELELIYKSNNLTKHLTPHVTALTTLPNTIYTPLNPGIILTVITLQQEYGLTFFDSHYAATALTTDREIISTNQAYHEIPGLTLINPDSYPLTN